MRALSPAPLEGDEFARFGTVVEADGREPFQINEGTSRRFADLAPIDVAGEGGAPCLSLFHATPWPQPIVIKMMERHPMGSQLFYPLTRRPFLVVVTEGAERPDPASIRVFRTNGRQGVSFHCNVWHHPLLVLTPDSDHAHREAQEFLVIDRKGPGDNLEEVWLDIDAAVTIEL